MWRKVYSDTMKHTQNLVNEWLGLACLLHDEVTTAFLRDLDECIAGHVLHTCTAFARLIFARSKDGLPHEKATKDTQQVKDKMSQFDIPSCVSCINSNSLFTTVLRNFQ